jgi:hypothetical protein
MRALLAALAVVATTPGVHHTPGGMTAAHRSLAARVDLGPGWKAGPTPKKPGALACRTPTSLKGVVETGAAVSPTYSASGSGPFVSGSAFVYDTAAGAARFFAQIAKPNALPCLAQSLATGKSTSGVTFTVTGRQTLAAPRVGVSAAAYRVVGRATITAQKVTVYADVILLQRGSTIAELTFASFSTPVPPTTETRIARAAASRL